MGGTAQSHAAALALLCSPYFEVNCMKFMSNESKLLRCRVKTLMPVSAVEKVEIWMLFIENSSVFRVLFH